MGSFFLTGILAVTLTAGVVDRVAVVVGKTVITESEVQQELRLTAFLNQQPVDLSPQARRAAAERLVDQTLIHDEMALGQYPEPSAAEAETLLRQYRQENYGSPAALRTALEKYGLNEEQLQRRLRLQVSTLRFTDLRFRAAVTPADSEQTANREGSASSATGDAVDREMEAWLKDKRATTKVQFKNEAFQ